MFFTSFILPIVGGKLVKAKQYRPAKGQWKKPVHIQISIPLQYQQKRIVVEIEKRFLLLDESEAELAPRYKIGEGNQC